MKKYPLPSDVALEITNICNARCFYCPLYQENDNALKYPRGYMDMGLFGKIIDEISAWPVKPSIYMDNAGEPLLDKHFEERIEYCASRYIAGSIILQTNAQFLDEHKSKILLDAGISHILPAFDGAQKETFEKHRVGCDYETVLNNILTFARLRDEKKARTTIQIKYMCTRQNMNETVDAWKLFREHLNPEKDRFQVEVTHTWNEENLKKSPHIIAAVNSKNILRPCRMAFSYLPVFVNGHVGGCSLDYNNNLAGEPFGDANKDSLEKIWYGRKFSSLRKKINFIMKYPQLPPAAMLLPRKCRNCYLQYYDPSYLKPELDDELLVYHNFTTSIFRYG